MSDIQILSRGFVATCVVSRYSGKHCVCTFKQYSFLGLRLRYSYIYDVGSGITLSYFENLIAKVDRRNSVSISKIYGEKCIIFTQFLDQGIKILGLHGEPSLVNQNCIYVQNYVINH